MADEKVREKDVVDSSPPSSSPDPGTDLQDLQVVDDPLAPAAKDDHGQDLPETKQRPVREAAFGDYLRIFSYATKWDFFAYAVGVLASMGAGITLPLMNVVFGEFVGTFTSFSGPSGDISISGFQEESERLALYMFALFLGRLFLAYINKFAFRMIGIRLSAAIRLHYLQHLFGQSIHVLDSMPPGYATTTITATSNILQLGISEKLGVFVEYTATIISAIAIAFTYSWHLALVVSSLLFFIAISVGILLPFIVKRHGHIGRSDAKASAIASETLASMRIIMACGAESRMSKAYSKFVTEAYQHSKIIAPLIATQFSLVFFAAFCTFALGFWYGTDAYLDGRLDDVGTILVVLFSVMMVVFSLERTSTPMLAVGKATVAACSFFTVIDAPRPNKGHLKDPEASASQDIILKNVTFAYPSRPHVKVLDDLDLRIEAGKITAIVGPSGSGKSTIVGLIERWYSLRDEHVIAKTIDPEKRKKIEKKKKAGEELDPDEEEELRQPEDSGPPVKLGGSVTTAGHALDDIELRWWRSQIGLVQQEPFLFNESIFRNVSYGLVGTEWESAPEEEKRELVKEACKEAFADEFIDRLPEGYDTLAGDSGARLSGGQRQRLAIARSIVRKPKILILDEATSAIDVRGEKIVQAALDKVAKNRTTITIAHRLSTIKKADRIVVLKKGKVVESGTHETLVDAQDGVYAGLVRAQALSLGEPTEASDDHPEVVQEDEMLLRKQSTAAASNVDRAPEAKAVKTRNIIDSFGRLLYESKQYWWMLIFTIFFSACAGAAMPIHAWIFAQIITVFNIPDRDELRNESEFWALMWFILAIGLGLSYFGGFFFSSRLSSFVKAKYQQEYFESVLFQKASYFDEEEHSQGTMTSNISRDPQLLEELMGANMAVVYVALFNIVGSIAIAFAFSWRLAIVGTSVIIPVSIFCSYWRFSYEIKFDKMNNDVFAESSKFASESIGAFRTVTSLTMEDAITTRFSELCKNHVTEAYKKARWVSFLFGLSDSITLACQTLIFYYGGILLADGDISLIGFFVCLMALMNAGESTGQSLSFGPNAAQVTAAANRILAMRESRLQVAASDADEIPNSKGGAKIELTNVYFKYPSRETPVFQGLDLTIEKGQFAALVGASGCGKTSIISLLERFYEVDKGHILFNGKDIKDINIYSYRKHLSLVAQEPTLFQGTIRENILLGVDPTAITDEDLHQACMDASIHEFISSLPEGYNTPIGSRGVSLSGGQKQRVSIARALIRKPDVLLLDEATSSLDSESEKLVQAAFERAGQGRTMVVVAHRLATVQNADVIFVLGDGALLERGNHAELLKKKGVYWQMCQSQALDR